MTLNAVFGLFTSSSRLACGSPSEALNFHTAEVVPDTVPGDDLWSAELALNISQSASIIQKAKKAHHHENGHI
jgi:hypothetical protein